VINADKICVLDAGKVVEQGSHDELLKLGGRYAKLVSRQTVRRSLLADGSVSNLTSDAKGANESKEHVSLDVIDKLIDM